MNDHNSLSSNWMSSHKWYLEILGALILSKANAITNLIAFSLIVGGIFYFTQWRNMFFFAAASLGVLPTETGVAHNMEPDYLVGVFWALDPCGN